MKKSNIIMSSILLLGVLSILIPTFFPESGLNSNQTNSLTLLSIFIYLGLFIIGLYYKFEESGISSKEISLIAVYSAFISIARIPFVGIPSVQPVSYLVFCAGYVFGPLIGFIIGGNTALISNIFLGQGIWTIYQIFAWGFIGIIGGLFGRKKNKTPNRIILAFSGFILGFLYGWIMNIWSWLMISPISIQSFIFINLNSLPFDLAHAVANFVFLYYFGVKTINILFRYRRRFLSNINSNYINDPIRILNENQLKSDEDA